MITDEVSVGGFRVLLPESGQQWQVPQQSLAVAGDRVSWLIVGNQEVSHRTGTSKALIHSWSSKPHRGFPAPIATLAAGPLFWWPEVAEWLIRQAQAAPGDRRRYVPPRPIEMPSEGPPRPSYLPLVGVGEIGERAGVQSLTVCNWRQRYATRDPRFPECVVQLALGPIFWWPDVQRWLTATGRSAPLGGSR